MLCHPADKLAGAFISCGHATVVWKQWKTQSTAIAPHHEYAHVFGGGPVGQTDTPLPSLGVSSLDLGRSHTERPLLCEDGHLPSHDRPQAPVGWTSGQLCGDVASAMQKNRLAFCAPHI